MRRGEGSSGIEGNREQISLTHAILIGIGCQPFPEQHRTLAIQVEPPVETAQGGAGIGQVDCALAGLQQRRHQ